MKTYVGIDPSLTGTGLVAYSDNILGDIDAATVGSPPADGIFLSPSPNIRIGDSGLSVNVVPVIEWDAFHEILE